MNSVYEKSGGFIKGICHPGDETGLMCDAGFKFARYDTPYPFENGGISKQYAAYRNRARILADAGIRSFGITPYPSAFIANGIDPREDGGLAKAAEVCEFLARDLSGIVDAWQITNEMYVMHFRAPLTFEESLDFIVACTDGVRRGNKAAVTGHNSAGTDDERIAYTREIETRTGGSDYIGLDSYCGTWGPGGPQSYCPEIDELYGIFRVPVLLAEFGFSSAGESMILPDDIDNHLKALGFKDYSDVSKNLDRYLDAINPNIAAAVRRSPQDERFANVKGQITHILKKWYYTGDTEHTQNGQARFYDELLPRLLENKNLCGAVVYCWQDSPRCFLCGDGDCPCETAWGIIDATRNPKPAYYAVKRNFA